jgi:thioredoxin 1
MLTDTVQNAPFVDPDRFAALVEQAPGLAVVDFTAAHCAPCRMLAPHVDELARELTGRVVVAKVDVDAEPALTARFGIRGTPTLLFFRDGQVVDKIVGAVPMAQLRAKVTSLRTQPFG